MSYFYKQMGVDRKCHIETLLKAYKEQRRFKSHSYLVDVIYYAELATGLLMGVHDLTAISGDISLFLASGEVSYEHISSKFIVPAKNSICLRDSKRIFGSLALGPDKFTKVTDLTEQAVLFIFIPPKIDQIIVNEKKIVISNILEKENISFSWL